MTVIDYHSREITCKVVYFGPGMSGKTTNLQWIHDHADRAYRGDIVSIATQSDRTLFFDYLPLDLGVLAGFSTRLHLYTVPGQPHYESTRKMVLDGADAVIFVADMQTAMYAANIMSFEDLHQHLAANGVDATTLPIVLQYNKVDFPADFRIPTESLNAALNYRNLPFMETSAIDGVGVFQTLKLAVTEVLHSLALRSSGSHSAVA